MGFPGEGVCEVCGVRFLLGGVGVKGYERLRDGDVWEDDHYQSKAHAGFVQIREKLAELRKARRGREVATRSRRGRAKDMEKNEKEKSRETDKSQTRSRSRDKKKDKQKEKEEEQEKEKGRGRIRSRTRSREKKKGKKGR